MAGAALLDPAAIRPRGATGQPDGTATEEAPDGPTPTGVPLVAVVTAVTLMPLLAPKLPANSAPVDLVMALGVGTVMVWAAVKRTRLHAPYVVPMTCLILAGVAPVLMSGSLRGFTALVQEIFLLSWCAVVVTVCRTPGGLRTVVRAWCLAAVAWAGFLVGAVLAGQPQLAGMSGPDGGRAHLLFDHPNMAGNYFMVSVLLVSAARYPQRPLGRAGCYLVLVTAMVFCGSNSALMSLPMAALLALVLRVRARSGTVAATTTALVIVAAVAGIYAVAAKPVSAAIERSENPIIKYSVGRGERSAAARESLFASQYQLFRQGSMLGVGPAGTRGALDRQPVSTAKESHNDYLATLVERGPLGVLALLALIGAITVRAARVCTGRLSAAYAAVLPNPTILAGAFVAYAFTAVTHEVLHYRHLWTLLGILAAVYLFGRAADGPAVAGPDPSAVRTGPPVPSDIPARAHGG